MVRESTQRGNPPSNKISKLNQLVEGLCGIYTRVARRLGVDRSFVSRVARGERRSRPIEDALVAEYDRVQGE
jgi:transcriptional regulator with XRE-family HTH domain